MSEGDNSLYFFILLALVIVSLAIILIRVPIIIAKNRGIHSANLTTISILSWVGIFFGITWIIALILSLSYQPQLWIEENSIKDTNLTNDELDRLLKLNDLKEKGILSGEEFETQKKELLLR